MKSPKFFSKKKLENKQDSQHIAIFNLFDAGQYDHCLKDAYITIQRLDNDESTLPLYNLCSLCFYKKAQQIRSESQLLHSIYLLQALAELIKLLNLEPKTELRKEAQRTFDDIKIEKNCATYSQFTKDNIFQFGREFLYSNLKYNEENFEESIYFQSHLKIINYLIIAEQENEAYRYYIQKVVIHPPVPESTEEAEAMQSILSLFNSPQSGESGQPGDQPGVKPRQNF